MAIETGDLYPHASGSASLGVEQIGLCGFTTDIRPFCHIHANSGVFHDPLYGSSGVFRFTPAGMELSNDGGLTFDVLMTSGLIDAGHSMQRAYDGGNEISIKVANGTHEGVLLRQNSTANGTLLPSVFGGVTDNYFLATSGISNTPNNPVTAPMVRMGSNGILIRGSGLDLSQDHPSELFMGSLVSPVFGAADGTMYIVGSGTGGLGIWTYGGLDIDVKTGNMAIDVDNGGLTIGLGGDWIASGPGTTFDFSAGIQFNLDCDAGSVMSRPFQNFIVEPFNASGALQYKFGPHQAWSWKPSYGGTGGPEGDGYFPLPHSGQILQMILENGGGGGTLQQAYNAGQRITTSLANGPVHIDAATTYGLRLDAAENDHPHILMSGVVELPQAAPTEVPGALWLQASSYGDGPAQLQGGSIPTTRAEASAKSLGIDTMFMTTGSGIVSLRAASGVSQFFNISEGGQVDDVGKIVPLSIETTASTFYHVTSTSGVQIFVPGFYRISYVCVLEKTLGNLGQQVDSELRVRDKWGQEFKLLGSDSSAIMRDSNTLNKNTCNGQSLTDLDPGDALVIYLTHNGAVPADNTIVIPARLSNIIVEWIGPQAGGKLIHQKIV
jgi:hypothetical protein